MNVSFLQDEEHVLMLLNRLSDISLKAPQWWDKVCYVLDSASLSLSQLPVHQCVSAWSLLTKSSRRFFGQVGYLFLCDSDLHPISH